MTLAVVLPHKDEEARAQRSGVDCPSLSPKSRVPGLPPPPSPASFHQPPPPAGSASAAMVGAPPMVMGAAGCRALAQWDSRLLGPCKAHGAHRCPFSLNSPSPACS